MLPRGCLERERKSESTIKMSVNVNREEATNVTSAAGVPDEYDVARAAKLQQRRLAWRINMPMLCWTIGVGVTVVVLSIVSYVYHSGTAGVSFLSLADEAAKNGKYQEQIKWLERYSLLHAEDRDAIVRVAIAADEAAEVATPERRFEAVDSARRKLSDSIARLGEEEDEDDAVNDLRARLIERLIQSGGVHYLEAERQVLALDAARDDSSAARWLALALVGRVAEAIYENKSRVLIDPDEDYWKWLSNQTPGEVLLRALELNPQDPDLISALLLGLTSNPEMFQLPIGSDRADTWKAELAASVDAAVGQLKTNADSRSAAILVQYYTNHGQPEAAKEILLEIAPRLPARLADAVAIETLQESGGKPEDTSVLTESLWDFRLLLTASNEIRTEDPELAQQWLESLLVTDLSTIPPELSEQAYLIAGGVKLGMGDVDQALSIWNRGLQDAPNSLTILESIANTQFANAVDDTAAAKEAIAQLRQAIVSNEQRLARLSDSAIPREIRSASKRTIESAKWKSDVMEAVLEYRTGDKLQAVRRLTAALNATVDVPVSSRLFVADQLAEIHERNGAWDQVATVLEQGIAYAPGDRQLRARIARAWQLSGNRLQAIEQWRMAGANASGDMQIASAEALFNYQLRLAPTERDFGTVRVAIQRIRKQLVDAEAAGVDDPVARSNSLAILDALDASLPPRGVEAETHLQSPEFAERIGKLAETNPKNAALQVFAAERLALVGQGHESDDALSRLAGLVGTEATELAVVKARIQSQRGNPIEASRQLAEQATRDPQRHDELLSLAAAYAMTGNDPTLAYQALNQIPKDRRTHDVLYRLAHVARGLPVDSPLLSVEGVKFTPEQLSIRWEDELREAEGVEGHYWKFLKINRLFDELEDSQSWLASEDPRLIEARKLVRELIADRPRWGEAISLQGVLMVLEAEKVAGHSVAAVAQLRENAVDQLRRGLAAGDRQMKTRFLLFNQLRLLGRESEAEKELELAEYASDAELDRYSAFKIDLAAQQGEFERSLRLAQQEADRNPDDFLSHVVLCRTATIAAKNSKDTVRRSELLEMAASAIDRAAALAGKEDVSMFSARLEMELVAGGDDGFSQHVDAIESTDFSPYDKATLKYRVFQHYGQFETAIEMLREAFTLKPSARNLMLQADLAGRLNRLGDQQAAIREALKLDPMNESLRFALARSIVAVGGDEIDWNEVARLLSGSDATSWKDRFLYAALLYQSGSDTQKEQATQILRELYQSGGDLSKDAGRFLAGILRQKLDSMDPQLDSSRKVLSDEIRAIYTLLTQGGVASSADLYAYAVFLLDQNLTEDLNEIRRIRDQLIMRSDGAVRALGISMMEAKAKGDQSLYPDVIQAWVTEVRERNSLDNKSIVAQAAATLVNLGFADLGVEYLEDLYEQHPDTLRGYVLALIRADQFDQALDACANHFDKHRDVESVNLLIEVLLAQDEFNVSPEYQQLINVALRDHQGDAVLLESVATLRFRQEGIQDAIALYRRALKINPTSVRALNNLAMAMSESPEHLAVAIEPIELAIKIAGEVSELLDTKGVVLLRAGRLNEAASAFEAALSQTSDPRFQFHLIVTLMAQQKNEEARVQWQSLDLDKLDTSGLTANELMQLDSMKKEFGS